MVFGELFLPQLCHWLCWSMTVCGQSSHWCGEGGDGRSKEALSLILPRTEFTGYPWRQRRDQSLHRSHFSSKLEMSGRSGDRTCTLGPMCPPFLIQAMLMPKHNPARSNLGALSPEVLPAPPSQPRPSQTSGPSLGGSPVLTIWVRCSVRVEAWNVLILNRWVWIFLFEPRMVLF